MSPIKLKSESVGYYRYSTDIELGKGNFANVYLARHKVVGCEVALKVINTEEIEDYVRRNLSREARILRDLHHRNIIRLYETVKTIKLYCLSLELIRGDNLHQYMTKQKTLKISERLATVFFYQMLSAVEYMHRLHVIHRDLKLENILVERGRVIKIIDFGLSNIYYPYFELRTHCGSVEYAAPELFRDTAYGTPADVWSLGVILYAMVVGRMPFRFIREKLDSIVTGEYRQLYIQRISNGLTQENWELMEDLSPECWNLLHDFLQPDQNRRIRLQDALVHHWITKDYNLKKRLPQSRKELHRKFHPEIIEYLAHKLNTSRSRIEEHINARSNDKISCMYYIVRDTLAKDVLYLPLRETSFLYQFQRWRDSRSLFPVQLSSYEPILSKEKGRNQTYFAGKPPAFSLTKVYKEYKMLPSTSCNIKDVDTSLCRIQFDRENQSQIPIQRISYDSNNSNVKVKSNSHFVTKPPAFSLTKVHKENKILPSKSCNTEEVSIFKILKNPNAIATDSTMPVKQILKTKCEEANTDENNDEKHELVASRNAYKVSNEKITNSTVPVNQSNDTNVNNDQENDGQVTHCNPYRSYKNSRPGVRHCKSSRSQNTQNSPFIRKKIAESVQDLKMLGSFQKERNKVHPIFYESRQNEMSNTGEESLKWAHWSFPSDSNAVEHSQIEPTACAEMAYSTNRISSDGNLEDNLKKSSLSEGGPKVKNIDSLKLLQKTRVVKKTENTNAVEFTPKKISIETSLTRHDRSTIQLERKTNAPSRIPIKNMRYGPPASLSRPIFPTKTQTKRASEIKGFEMCKGDTNE